MTVHWLYIGTKLIHIWNLNFSWPASVRPTSICSQTDIYDQLYCHNAKTQNLAILSGCNDLNYDLCCCKVTKTWATKPLHPACLITFPVKRFLVLVASHQIYTLAIQQICVSLHRSHCYHLENDRQPLPYCPANIQKVHAKEIKTVLKNRYIAIQHNVNFCIVV